MVIKSVVGLATLVPWDIAHGSRKAVKSDIELEVRGKKEGRPRARYPKMPCSSEEF